MVRESSQWLFCNKARRELIKLLLLHSHMLEFCFFVSACGNATHFLFRSHQKQPPDSCKQIAIELMLLSSSLTVQGNIIIKQNDSLFTRKETRMQAKARMLLYLYSTFIMHAVQWKWSQTVLNLEDRNYCWTQGWAESSQADFVFARKGTSWGRDNKADSSRLMFLAAARCSWAWLWWSHFPLLLGTHKMS